MSYFTILADLLFIIYAIKINLLVIELILLSELFNQAKLLNKKKY